jgi:catechol 2,3-dioxygenase-like lactoylglutathione lyase family enzyme
MENMARASSGSKARLVGINHVAIEVGDVEAALAFYGRIFEFTLRGRTPTMAFIDMGDQFIALSEGRTQKPDEHRHFGLVVDDRARVRAAAEAAGARVLPTGSLDFLDPWGNRLQIVEYRDIQFSKTAPVLQGMGLAQLEKSAQALAELEKKGMAPSGQRTPAGERGEQERS